MISLRETITTTRPRDEAFAYVGDFTTVAEWDPGIVASVLTSGDGGLGTTYAVTARFRGRDVPLVYEVVVYEPPGRIVLRGEAAAFGAVDAIELVEEDGGTRITYSAEFKMKGFLRLVEPLLGGALRKLGRTAVAGLAKALG